MFLHHFKSLKATLLQRFFTLAFRGYGVCFSFILVLKNTLANIAHLYTILPTYIHCQNVLWTGWLARFALFTGQSLPLHALSQPRKVRSDRQHLCCAGKILGLAGFLCGVLGVSFIDLAIHTAKCRGLCYLRQIYTIFETGKNGVKKRQLSGK